MVKNVDHCFPNIKLKQQEEKLTFDLRKTSCDFLRKVLYSKSYVLDALLTKISHFSFLEVTALTADTAYLRCTSCHSFIMLFGLNVLSVFLIQQYLQYYLSKIFGGCMVLYEKPTSPTMFQG